jgi:adenosylcobinamide-GDP ribazoletransferase
MDGLMDTADGVLSHRSRERMLEIMKDSRVGAMGVIVGGWMLLMKAALLYALLEFSSQWLILLAIIPIWSRLFMVVAIVRWPYARVGEGMGRLVATVSYKECTAAGLLALGITVLILVIGGGTGLLALILCTLIIAVATLVLGGLLAHYLANKLGGLTGDTYGALNEWLEAALLLGAVMWAYSV